MRSLFLRREREMYLINRGKSPKRKLKMMGQWAGNLEKRTQKSIERAAKWITKK